MPLQIVRNDITKMAVDAIVNAASASLLGGGGVDGAIHRAAGPELLAECRTLHGCATGEAKLTKGYNLPCKYVIHTVGPIWKGGGHGERELLSACYTNALALALAHDCESVAFPLISSGVFGYPKAQAMQVAVEAITGFLVDHDMTVYIVVFDKASLEVGGKLFDDIAAYIDDVYVAAHADAPGRRPQPVMLGFPPPWNNYAPSAAEQASMAVPGAVGGKYASLDGMLEQVDESFAQALLRLIDQKHMSDAACYKKANIDRRLFNKIKNHSDYKPSKQTALAFAIALELTLPQTKELLMKAGFALSHSSKADIVVEYCISRGVYDIIEINQILFRLDLQPLGY